MRQVARIGVLLPAMLIVVSGCATKSWVQEELGRRDAELNQRIAKVGDQAAEETQRVDKRVEGVEGRVTEETQKVDGIGSRVGTLETSLVSTRDAVVSTSEAVRTARERADGAMARAEGVDGRLTRLWANRYNPRVVETVHVHFGFGRATLDDGAQTALLGLVKELQANQNLAVELTGYTDMKGPREYNVALSQRRVESVRRFLVEKGVQLARIQALGLGAMTDSATPETQKRRVTAKLMLDQD
jgi:outer membrane protein OmpA-like peptidoglycan-associated protein